MAKRKRRSLTGFSREIIVRLERRAAIISKVTQRKGMPMRFGEGKKVIEVPPMPADEPEEKGE